MSVFVYGEDNSVFVKDWHGYCVACMCGFWTAEYICFLCTIHSVGYLLCLSERAVHQTI